MAELSRSQILKNPEVLGTGTSGAQIILHDGDESNHVALKAPDTITTNFTLTFPANDGTPNQYLQTDGDGIMSWVTAGLQTPGGAEGYIQYYSSGSFAGAAGVTTDGVHLTLKAAGEVRFADTDSSNYVSFKAPGTVAANRAYTLPATIGSAGQVLKIATGATATAATLEWADDLQAAGSSTASGAAGSVQLSDGAGGFTSDVNITYNTTTDVLTLGGSLTAEAITVNNLSFDLNTISSSSGDIILSPTVATSIYNNKQLNFYDSDNSNYVGLLGAASVTSDYQLQLPGAVGAVDDVIAITAVAGSPSTATLSYISNYRTINFLIDGGSSVITAGVKGFVVVDFDCQILQWTIQSDLQGSIVVDVWKKAYAANTVPTVLNTIAGSAKPTLANSLANQNTSLSGNWSTLTISAGDVLAFNVEATPATVTKVTVALKVRMT
jgi:hypothetical protein